MASGSLAEGWGLSLTEGAGVRTPAVATDIRGHRSSVVDGVTGILAPPDQLGAELARVLLDDALRLRLGQAALERARTLTWDASALGIIRVLHRAVTVTSRERLAPVGCRTDMRSVIVLPTYNEGENIEPFLRAVRKAAPTTDVLVVDDNSPDGTGRIAEAIGAELGRIEVLHRAAKHGLGSAYRDGFARVLDGPYDVVISMDADFSHDPEQLSEFIRLIAEGADVVIGSRYITGGGTTDWPVHRQLLSKWGNALHAGDPRRRRSRLHQRVPGLPGDVAGGDRSHLDVGRGLRVPHRTRPPAHPRRRDGGRDADHLPRPNAGQVEDVGPHHCGIDAARDRVGPARPVAPVARPLRPVMTDPAPVDPAPADPVSAGPTPADAAAVGDGRWPAWLTSKWTTIVVVTIAVALPLIVAVATLSGRRWFPVLDLAMTSSGCAMSAAGTRH